MSKIEYVQYIVVRKDLVPTMGYGKTAAQVAHASLGVIIGRENLNQLRNGDGSFILDYPNVVGWFNGPFVKLVVYVKTKQKLLNLASKLDEEQIKYKLIYDACRTMLEPEEENGSTLTCMGVSPVDRNNVPKCLRGLQLLD